MYFGSAYSGNSDAARTCSGHGNTGPCLCMDADSGPPGGGGGAGAGPSGGDQGQDNSGGGGGASGSGSNPRNFGADFDGTFHQIANGESCAGKGYRELTFNECGLRGILRDAQSGRSKGRCASMEGTTAHVQSEWASCTYGSGNHFGLKTNAWTEGTGSACSSTGPVTDTWSSELPLTFTAAPVGTADAGRTCGADRCFCANGNPSTGASGSQVEIAAGQSCAGQGLFEPSLSECKAWAGGFDEVDFNRNNLAFTPCIKESWGYMYFGSAYSGNSDSARTCSGHGNTGPCLCMDTDSGPPAPSAGGDGGGGGGGGGGGKAGGDPHLLNIKGERFNINRIGKAPLVSITSDGAAHLEVMALIEGVKQCQKKMFITQVNASGSWLEKNVAVQVGSNVEKGAFSLTIDGKEVWSPPVAGYQPPTVAKTVFNHANKFSIDELSAKATPANQPGLEITTAHDVKLKIVRPLRRPTAPPHLNFDIQGLKKIPLALKIGGLLGQDDHSYWSARDENCGVNFARAQREEGSV